jgi:hypothetical protein
MFIHPMSAKLLLSNRPKSMTGSPPGDLVTIGTATRMLSGWVRRTTSAISLDLLTTKRVSGSTSTNWRSCISHLTTRSFSGKPVKNPPPRNAGRDHEALTQHRLGNLAEQFLAVFVLRAGFVRPKGEHALVGDHVLGHLGEIRERRVRFLLARASRPGHLHHHFLNIEGVVRRGLIAARHRQAQGRDDHQTEYVLAHCSTPCAAATSATKALDSALRPPGEARGVHPSVQLWSVLKLRLLVGNPRRTSARGPPQPSPTYTFRPSGELTRMCKNVWGAATRAGAMACAR